MLNIHQPIGGLERLSCTMLVTSSYRLAGRGGIEPPNACFIY